MADQSAGDTSLPGDYHPNSSQKQGHNDDSAEFQDSNGLVENLQIELGKWIDQVRRARLPTGAGDRNLPKLAPLEKSLNEVQVVLRHLNQNVHIPDVHLEINDHIKEIVETARAHGKKPNAADLGELLEDADFLNSLQNGVNRWIEAIRKVTRMDRDPSSGTALQEASFWTNLERALIRIQEMRESDEVVVTLEALKAGWRFHAITSFDYDTGLKEMLYVAHDYNQLMKNIPLNDLMAATDLDAAHSAMANIFISLKRMRYIEYPLKRAVQFFMTISKDLCEQIIQLLKPHLLMHAPMSELDEIMTYCSKIWILWDEEADKVQTTFREMYKKQRADEEIKFLYRAPYRHKELEKRLEDVHKFRKQHEQLGNFISRVLRSHKTREIIGMNTLENVGHNPEEKMANAYEAIKEVNYLDLSQAGQQAWESSMQYYKEHVGGIEIQLASRIRDQLATAKNADEMFSVFSRYKLLFVHPHIRTVIREYQTTLIGNVKADIVTLGETILDNKKRAMALRVADNYDIPDFSAKVMWLRQIEILLKMNMIRIEDVLGEQWTNHPEGKELKKECDLLREKLDTRQMYNEWTERVISILKSKTSSDKLFYVEKQQRDGKIVCRIRVNFSPDSIKIAKEVRNLKNMGFRIPFKIMTYSSNISAYYPYAISLLESVRIFESTNEILASRQSIESLVAGHRKSIHELLAEGYKTDWGSFKLEPYVHKLNEAVGNYQEKVTELIECLDKIEVELSALDKCQYKQTAIAQVLGSIQSTVDQMAHNNYSNLNKWIENLDKTLESKLARRVEEAIHMWTTVLKQQSRDELLVEDEHDAANIVPEIQNIQLEIRIIHQHITVMPTLERAKASLFDQFFAWHAIITEQPRVSCTRFQTRQQSQDTYKGILMKLPKKLQVLTAAYEAIDGIMNKANDYVNQWTRHQALWNLQPDILFERLGNDLNSWMKVIMEIKKSRAMVDSPESQHKIFPFVVDYTRVQSKISMKYDYWQREVLQKFGNQLGTSMQNFFTEISKTRLDLESQSTDSRNASDTVALLIHLQNLKKQLKTSQEQVDTYIAGQKLLSAHRYTFPQAWLYSENIDGEWSALQDLLNRKDTAIQSQAFNLQIRILVKDKQLEKHINDLIPEWNKSKPISGTQRPKEALILLGNFEDKFKRLKDEQANIVKVKNALEISDSMVHVNHQATNNKLEMAMEELNDLSSVWKCLLPIYDDLDELKEQQWLSVQPRKLRQNLEELLGRLKGLPSQFKSYDAYNCAERLLQNYSKMNILIMELKSEALKERHWRALMKEMNTSWVLTDLTLGQVWDVDLSRYESKIKDVLLVAQGELALKEYMRQVREYWTEYTVELINYQEKTNLIRGWDDLFNKLKEHMNSLNHMKLSPYYKQFEEDALEWEDKLNRINSLFDIWNGVQRRWVYLERVFAGSADIAHLLPSERSRFNMASNKFLGLMRKVTTSPRILDVVLIKGAQKILKRLENMLSKELGEYLERERNSFTRFYFIGDKDLLEILGNPKDLLRVQKHFKKMFAGIVAIVCDDEKHLIIAICSREGETVTLKTPVDLSQNPRINEWLRKLEQEMQTTLAKLLADSLAVFTKFDANTIKLNEYLEWIDSYPAQIVGIATHV